MILEWNQVNPVEGLKLQWVGPNLFGDDWVETTIGTVTSMEQISQKVSVIMGPQGPGAPPRIASLQFVIDGAGAPITAGETAELPGIPFDCTIIDWTLTANVAGSTVVTLFRTSFEDYPNNFVEISGTEKPNLVAEQKKQDTALTTWDTQLSTGDVLRAVIDSSTTIERLHIGLRVQENS